MIKNILAIATVALMATACSSSSSSDPEPTGGGTTPPVSGGGGTPPPAPGGGNPPATDTKAGAYFGDFGSGSGVYVISNENELSGLALAADGSAFSLFGNLGTGNTFSGDLSSYFHVASATGNADAFGPGNPGAGAPVPAPTTFNLNIVNGQTIESLSGTEVLLTGAGDGGLTPANSGTLAGTWTGTHSFASTGGNSQLVTTITFNGTEVSGGTDVFSPTGESQFPAPIAGTITDFGDVALLSFTWQDNVYEGSVFFAAGSNSRLVFIGETAADIPDGGRKTIASILTR